MNELIAQLRAFFTRSSYLLTVGGLAALTVAAAGWVAVPARKEAALLSAEAARLQAVIASSNSWVTQFQTASSEESALWQNTAFQVQALGVRPSERLTLAQVIARRAEEAGLGSSHIRFLPVDAAALPPPRQVAGISFKPAQYNIQVTGTGGFGALSSLIGALPPAVDLRSVSLARDSSNRVITSLTLSVFEPAGGNGK
jgi:hypothetical protein